MYNKANPKEKTIAGASWLVGAVFDINVLKNVLKIKSSPFLFWMAQIFIN